MSKKKDFKFDKRAEKYDNEFEERISEKFYNPVTENAVLSDGFNVLDMGCGTGTVLRRLSEKRKISCFGIDVEEKCWMWHTKNVLIWISGSAHAVKHHLKTIFLM